jgi:Zn finger protein HypA/HybF involved in hydrogenase expression
MHEFSIVKKEVERTLLKVKDRQVSKVVFLLGRLAHGTPQSIRQAFQIACQDTSLAKAELEVITVQPRVKCSNCFKVFTPLENFMEHKGNSLTGFTPIENFMEHKGISLTGFTVDKKINLSCPDCHCPTNELISGEECYIDSVELNGR